jgi:hypothetical protein
VLLLGQEDEAEASRYGPATRKRAWNSKCEKRFGKRNREIMRKGFDEGSRWARAEGAGKGTGVQDGADCSLAGRGGSGPSRRLGLGRVGGVSPAEEGCHRCLDAQARWTVEVDIRRERCGNRRC